MKTKLISGHTDAWHKQHRVIGCNYCKKIQNILKQKIKTNGLTQDDLTILNQIRAIKHKAYLEILATVTEQKQKLIQAINNNLVEDSKEHTATGQHELNNYQQQVICSTHETILK